MLEKELYISKENYKKVKKIYKDEQVNLKISNSESPVFNFHLNKIIEKMNNLDELIGSNI